MEDLSRVGEVADVTETKYGLNLLPRQQGVDITTSPDIRSNNLGPGLSEPKSEQMPDLDDGFLDDLGLVLLLIIGLALILEECLPLFLLLLLRRFPLLVLLLVSHHREDTGLLHLIGSGRQRVPLDQSHLLEHSLNGVEHEFVGVIDEVEGGC